MAVTVKNNVIRMTADDDTYSPGGKMKIKGVRLISGIDASTALIKENDTNGAVLISLKAAANLTEESYICFTVDVGSIHLDLTGTSSEVFVYLE